MLGSSWTAAQLAASQEGDAKYFTLNKVNNKQINSKKFLKHGNKTEKEI
jgi:hypothetical protein